MKATYKVNDRLTLEIDYSTDVELVEALAHIDEVFDMTCEKFGLTSDKVKWRIRQDKDDNKYYELVCVDRDQPKLYFCKKSFGQHKKGGGLFPRNKDDEGNYNPWRRYDKELGKEV